jgi:hypothetical protein
MKHFSKVLVLLILSVLYLSLPMLAQAQAREPIYLYYLESDDTRLTDAEEQRHDCGLWLG